MNCEEFTQRNGREAFERIFLPRAALKRFYPIYFANNMLFILSEDWVGQFIEKIGLKGICGLQKAKDIYQQDHSVAEWEYALRTTPIDIEMGTISECTHLVLPTEREILKEALILNDDDKRFCNAFHQAQEDITHGRAPHCPSCERRMEESYRDNKFLWICRRHKGDFVLP